MSRMGYMNWLISHIDKRSNYESLLSHLFNSEYRCLYELDENRAHDGVNLRYDYMNDTGDNPDISGTACSMLELLISVSIRVESAASCIEYDDRTADWFWIMIDNLGLGEFTNDRYDGRSVDYVLERFMSHMYAPNGKGSLFTINNPKTDLRNEDLWYQICGFVNQILPESNY